MALNTTTLSSAVGVLDTSIVVASATGAAAGTLALVDQEVMQIAQDYTSGTTIPVLRGRDGTAQVAHKTSANLTFFLASDQGGPPPQAVVQYPSAGRSRRVLSFSAAGAITLPGPGEDLVAVINGTSALAMTLANPTKDMDGSLLIIVANGKAAHTVTYTAGLGNGGTGFDVGTFSATLAGGCTLIAANGFWCAVGNGILGATAATGAPLWA